MKKAGKLNLICIQTKAILIYLFLFLLLFSTRYIYGGNLAEKDTNYNQADNKVLTDSNDFFIVNYGAVGDGVTLNSTSIQSAIDACAESGGGRVIFTKGKFLSGTIILRNNVELHFEQNSELLGSTRHEDYPIQPLPKYRSLKDQAGGFYALIYAEGAENISITGKGTINGQGALQKKRADLIADDIDGRPRNLLLVSCKNVLVDGIRMINSGIWNQHYLNCEDVIVKNIYVYNHSNHNNDGIDIDGCRRFILSNSILDSDDDCVTFKSTGPAISEDITVTNCIIGTFCNAIKAGTESTGGFRNISISNCVIRPSISEVPSIFNTPKIGITGITLIIVDGGTMEGITINNITIYGTMYPIFIRLGNRARIHTPGAPIPDVGRINNISLSNIVIYGAGNGGSSITGISGHPVKNISLSNIQLFTSGGITKNDYDENLKEDDQGYPQPWEWGKLPSYGFFIRHAEEISINNLMLGVVEKDQRPPIIAEDVTGLQIKGCQLIGNDPVFFVVGKSLQNYIVDKPLGWKGDKKKYIEIIK